MEEVNFISESRVYPQQHEMWNDTGRETLGHVITFLFLFYFMGNGNFFRNIMVEYRKYVV